MIFKNLFRRQGRTSLTVLGIAIGVAAIVALGAVAGGMKAGLTSMTRGGEADLVITQGDALSVILSSVEDTVVDEVRAWPGVADVEVVLLGNAMLDGGQQFFLFGHDPEGFSVRHYRIVEGQSLAAARGVRGKPLILGKRASLSMGRTVGDAMRLGGAVFRVVGIYETGISYEELGAVIGLREIQALTGKLRQVMYYQIKLRDPKQAEVVLADLAAEYPGVDFSLAAEAVQSMSDFAVMEQMVAQVSLLGILIGLGLGRLVTLLPGLYGGMAPLYSPKIFVQALLVAAVAGTIGGLYPAWRATRMRPVEALRYE